MDDRDLDLIGDDDAEREEHETWPGGGLLQAVTAPEALALASVLVAVASLLGLGLLNGSPYVPVDYGPTGPDEELALVASLLGAGLALVPAGLGLVALRRLPRASTWSVVAGAGVLVALLSVLLRLLVAVRMTMEDTTPFVQF